jgi:uncharacterized membrane protein YvbJ
MENCTDCGKEISNHHYHEYDHLCEDCYRLNIHRKKIRAYLVGFSGFILILFGLLSFYLGRIILSLGTSLMRDFANVIGFTFIGLGIFLIVLSAL